VTIEIIVLGCALTAKKRYPSFRKIICRTKFRNQKFEEENMATITQDPRTQTIAPAAPAPVKSSPVKPIALGASAAEKVAELLKQEASTDYFLRIAVQPGGCSGLRYALYFDDQKLEGDVITPEGGFEVRVDRMSAPYLQGAQLEWMDGLEQSGFTINNPNAKGSCACGDSFH